MIFFGCYFSLLSVVSSAGICCTDSTRAVYQRKLQRWLQYGPTHDNSTLESSLVEPNIDVAAQSEASSVDDEPAIRNSLGNNTGIIVGNGHATSSTVVSKCFDAATSVLGLQQVSRVSPVKMSRSELDQPPVQAYSLTHAECGSASYTGWLDSDQFANGKAKPVSSNRLLKPKANAITTDEPLITPG